MNSVKQKLVDYMFDAMGCRGDSSKAAVAQ